MADSLIKQEPVLRVGFEIIPRAGGFDIRVGIRRNGGNWEPIENMHRNGRVMLMQVLRGWIAQVDR